MKEIGPNGIEAYFKREVKKAGGMTEKHVSPGKKLVPDQLVTWPYEPMHLVELKAPRTKGRIGDQSRDHKTRAKYGVYVHVLHTKELVDRYIRSYGRQHVSPTPHGAGPNTLLTTELVSRKMLDIVQSDLKIRELLLGY
jgi:hypothetical protein